MSTTLRQVDPGTRVVHRSCTLCEALCGLDVQLTGDRITAITGDQRDPLSSGYLCPKGVANIDLQHDSDRLTRPLVKQPDGSFAEVSWDVALDRAGELLRGVRRDHGRDALATYVGNPTAHNPAALFLLPLIRLLGSRNRYSASSVDQVPQSLAAYLMFGHQLLFPLPDLDRTDHLLIIGANPIVSNGSLVTAPDWRGRLRSLRDRGGRVVVIDPRRTETARVADQHVAIRPGTDVILLAAMVNLLFEEDRVRLGRLAAFTDGVDTVRAAVKPFTVDDAARVTGVPKETIVSMARELADADRATVYARVGICHTKYGSVSAWLVNLLNLLTGNLDRVGGAMFATPAVDLHKLVALAVGAGSHDTYRSRVRGLPEVNHELPVATLADEILTPGRGQVRGLLVNAGNPVLSTPNGVRLDEAIGQLDAMVAIDFYVNETNRHADVILPPTAPFEHDHYDVVFHGLAVRNTTRLSTPVLTPALDAKHDHEIVIELATRLLGHGRVVRTLLRPLAGLGRVLTPTRVVAAALSVGPWGTLRRGRRGITWRQVKNSPHGLDLGPLEPGRLPGRLWHRDGRIQAAPRVLVAELDVARRAFVDLSDPDATRIAAADELVLIGRRHLRSNNSWLHNSERLTKGRDRCTLLVHPEDAAARTLHDGGVAAVTSTIGEVHVTVEVDDEIMPGVVSLPHGWGHDRDGTQWQVAEANAGVSINDLTDHDLVDTLTGNAAFNEVRVTVKAI